MKTFTFTAGHLFDGLAQDQSTQSLLHSDVCVRASENVYKAFVIFLSGQKWKKEEEKKIRV